MATKYQIFVSSTYEDLKSERDRVIQGILEMGHIPVGMEMFSAADEAQWQIIARHIDESDYYVVIIAHRYGSMDGATSYTRKEYEYAVSRGLPVVGFVIDPEAAWPGNRRETEAAMLERLADFKELVEKKPVGYWTNADDLYGKASVALVKTMTAQPRVGWVRASSAAGPEVTAELSRLSAENASLRSKLVALEEQSERDNTAELAELWVQMKGNGWEYSARFAGSGDWVAAQPIKYSHLFQMLAPNMVLEASVDLVDNLLKLHSTKKRAVGEVEVDEPATAIPINERNALLADFMMLGVMEPSTRRHPVADKTDYWALTDYGRELLKMRKRADFATTAAEATQVSDAAP